MDAVGLVAGEEGHGVRDLHRDEYEVIAAGQAVAISTRHADRLRSDLTAVALEGAEPSRVVLARRAGVGNRLLAAFRETVVAHLAGAHHSGAATAARSQPAAVPRGLTHARG